MSKVDEMDDDDIANVPLVVVVVLLFFTVVNVRNDVSPRRVVVDIQTIVFLVLLLLLRHQKAEFQKYDECINLEMMEKFWDQNDDDEIIIMMIAATGHSNRERDLAESTKKIKYSQSNSISYKST